MSENEKNSFRDHDSSFDNTIPNESVNYVLEIIGGESCYMPFNIEYFGEIYRMSYKSSGEDDANPQSQC